MHEVGGWSYHDSKSLFTIIVAYMVQSVSSLWVRNFQFREHGRLPMDRCLYLERPHLRRPVSRCSLAVRRLAGKQKDFGSIRFGSTFSSLQKW